MNTETERKEKSTTTDKGRRLHFGRCRIFIYCVGRSLCFFLTGRWLCLRQRRRLCQTGGGGDIAQSGKLQANRSKVCNSDSKTNGERSPHFFSTMLVTSMGFLGEFWSCWPTTEQGGQREDHSGPLGFGHDVLNSML